MRLVTLNGPIGCGKSWVVKNLRVRTIPMSFQDTLAKSTQVMLGVEWMDYATFKTTLFNGKTGREWMIIVATECRRHDEYFFARVLHDRMKHQTHSTERIFIADSNGFENELDYMRSQADVDLLACSIEPPNAPPRGAQYMGDSRFNLAHKCTVVSPNSTLMLDALNAALIRRAWA